MLAVLSHTLFLSHVVFAHVVLKLSACATSFHCAYRRKFRAMSDFSVKRGPESMSLVADCQMELCNVDSLTLCVLLSANGVKVQRDTCLARLYDVANLWCR